MISHNPNVEVGLRSGAKIGSWISDTFLAWWQVSIVLYHFRLKQPTDWKFGAASTWVLDLFSIRLFIFLMFLCSGAGNYFVVWSAKKRIDKFVNHCDIGCGNKQRQRGNALSKNSTVISAVYGYSTCFLPNLQVYNPRKKQPRNELNNSWSVGGGVSTAKPSTDRSPKFE